MGFFTNFTTEFCQTVFTSGFVWERTLWRDQEVIFVKNAFLALPSCLKYMSRPILSWPFILSRSYYVAWPLFQSPLFGRCFLLLWRFVSTHSLFKNFWERTKFTRKTSKVHASTDHILETAEPIKAINILLKVSPFRIWSLKSTATAVPTPKILGPMQNLCSVRHMAKQCRCESVQQLGSSFSHESKVCPLLVSLHHSITVFWLANEACRERSPGPHIHRLRHRPLTYPTLHNRNFLISEWIFTEKASMFRLKNDLFLGKLDKKNDVNVFTGRLAVAEDRPVPFPLAETEKIAKRPSWGSILVPSANVTPSFSFNLPFSFPFLFLFPFPLLSTSH